MENPMLNPNPYMALSGSLGFSAADMTANRLGVLTADQRQRLITLRQQALVRPAMVLALLLVGGLLLQAEWVVIAFAAACLVSFMIVIWQRFADDLEGRVEAIAGTWTLQNQALGRRAVLVGSQVLNLPPQASGVPVVGNVRYRVYFTPGTRTILSAEMIS